MPRRAWLPIIFIRWLRLGWSLIPGVAVFMSTMSRMDSQNLRYRHPRSNPSLQIWRARGVGGFVHQIGSRADRENPDGRFRARCLCAVVDTWKGGLWSPVVPRFDGRSLDVAHRCSGFRRIERNSGYPRAPGLDRIGRHSIS